MKYLILIAASAALVGCGKVSTNGSRLGESLKLDPVSASVPSGLRELCQVMASKVLSTNQTYRFDYATKVCYDPDLSASKQPSFVPAGVVETNIVTVGETQTFRRSDNGTFFDVETSTSGVVSAICKSLNDFKNQILLADGQVITVSTNTYQTDCSAGYNQKCLAVYYYSQMANDPGTYKNHTAEFIKFDTNPQGGYRGFWAERKRVSSASCGGFLRQEQLATFKY